VAIITGASRGFGEGLVAVFRRTQPGTRQVGTFLILPDALNGAH
jgi:NAD(P)-dependent dehydrogenase (short-subunit alcohol dehydrogenase family)